MFKDAISLAKALAIQLAAGMPMASEEEQNKRHEICQSCPSDMFNKEEYRCKVCNCFLKFKIPLGTSECPQKHWGKSTGDNNVT